MTDDVVPEELSTEAMLEQYGKMSGTEQKEKFNKIFDSLSKHGKNRLFWLFVFVSNTSSQVISIDNEKAIKKYDLHQEIIKVNEFFSYLKRISNLIARESLEIFFETLSEGDERKMFNFFIRIRHAINFFDGETNEMREILEGFKRRRFSRFSRLGVFSPFSRLMRQEEWFRDKIGKFRLKNILEDKKNAFYQTAEKYRIRGEWFLSFAMVAVGILILWGGILLWGFFDKNVQGYVLIGQIAGKTIISATLFFSLVSLLRIYFANKHNEAIYRQKSDILESYQLIYNTSDEKGIVLRKAIESLFEQKPTAFSKLQSDSGLGNLAAILTKLIK